MPKVAQVVEHIAILTKRITILMDNSLTSSHTCQLKLEENLPTIQVTMSVYPFPIGASHQLQSANHAKTVIDKFSLKLNSHPYKSVVTAVHMLLT